MMKRLVLAASLALALSACDQQRHASSNRHLSPIPPATMALMSQKGMSKGDPILMRLYKKESELEVWKKAADGRYALLKTYPICRWSGQLGPKVREGDRQAPEGFYTVTPALMNPNSSFYLSFNTGFPNAYDRAHGRSGSHLMVHGSCSSRGCFAMTDEAIAEVYSIAREAFAGGQRGFQFQAYPFRMTTENLAKARHDEHIAFWRNLKEGADHFEMTRREPTVEVCGRRYAFNTQNCAPVDSALTAAIANKQAQDEQRIAESVARGTPAVKFVYDDGGGHPSFQHHAVATTIADPDRAGFAVLQTRPRRNLGDVSRPEALSAGLREVPVDGSGRVARAAEPAIAPEAPALAYAGAAAPTAPQPAPTAQIEAERPFLKRMIGDLFAKSPFASAATPSISPSQALPSGSPMPPRRGAADSASDRRAALSAPAR